MTHQVDYERLTSDSARPPGQVIVEAAGLSGFKRLAYRVDHRYEKVSYLVIFDGVDVPIGDDGGLEDAIAVYNAIDEDRPCGLISS